MMKELDKRFQTTNTKIEPNEGERTLLSSNNSSSRSPSLDFLDTSSEDVSEQEILDYLARIISLL